MVPEQQKAEPRRPGLSEACGGLSQAAGPGLGLFTVPFPEGAAAKAEVSPWPGTL